MVTNYNLATYRC